MAGNLVKNAAGRMVPLEIGSKHYQPFKGAFATRPTGIKATPKLAMHRRGRSKLLPSIEAAIKATGLKSGMTVSFHHHLRNGDYIMNMVMDKIAKMGIKDIKIVPSAMFPVHEHLIKHIKKGVISRIEGSMNGPIGRLVSYGGALKEPGVLRSHGGRTRAVEAGDIHIDVAFLGFPTVDEMGNCNGAFGKSAFGTSGFTFIDAWYADKVVVITDNLQPYPVTPISISQIYVDHVVEVDSIGDPQGILWGTTQVTRSPTRLMIAEYCVEVLKQTGFIKDGFSFQAGAGGISLAVTKFLGDYLKEEGIVASFAMGGITKFVTDILESGNLRAVLDAQSFDLDSLESLRTNPNHIEVSHYMFGNPHTKGCITHMMDACFLGATEVDLEFNVNVNTHSDGLLLHGIGGHADAAAGANVTIIAVPLLRKRIPVIVDKVTTITAPGETVDVIVTEYGLALNPKRKDLLKKLKGSDLPLTTIKKLKDRAEGFTGKPEPPKLGDEIVALVEYRDGTLIDTVKNVLK
ncbi:MAG: citrate lyase subunit alpha [Thermoplasmata archaeon]|nr:citrate lyase subunit alpha [Thermoplasmata archaeon]